MPGTRPFLLALLTVSLLLIAGAVLFLTKPLSGPINQEVNAGWRIWRINGCEGCHSLYGHGGSEGPDLTHVIQRQGESRVHDMLNFSHSTTLQGWSAPRYGLTAREMDTLIAFLRWVGEQEPAQAGPPTPIALTQVAS